MPKKSKEVVLRDRLVGGFQEAGIRLTGKTFGLGDHEGWCADYVFGNVVIEVITSHCEKRLARIEKFKKTFGRRYTVFAFTDDHMKDVLMIGKCDALYTVSSLRMLISKAIEINKE